MSAQPHKLHRLRVWGEEYLQRKQIGNDSLVVWATVACLFVFIAWASIFSLDEVTTGTGKVVPTSKEQVVQSLEGGIVSQLDVREGDVVEAGQVLAKLDPTKTAATVEESASQMRAALATSARLSAEVNGTPLQFPPEVQKDAALVHGETALYRSRRESLQQSAAGLEKQLGLVQQELRLTEPLVAKGAASDVELIRLRQQQGELQNKLTDLRTQYFVKSREELAKANAEVLQQQSVTRGRADALARSTIVSPVRGIVKNLEVTTIGGVVPPSGKLMEIVPLDDQLLIEARIAPRDVAFLHPGQRAVVKITAYDFHIYGGLEGKVAMISPDTIQDEVKRDVYYYRVYVRTDRDHLTNKAGKAFGIFPGMIADVDIHTGSKTVMAYLVKPLNRAREALRER